MSEPNEVVGLTKEEQKVVDEVSRELYQSFSTLWRQDIFTANDQVRL